VKSFLRILLIFILVVACQKKQENKNSELTFRINQNLLGQQYRNDLLGFSFSPPKSCLPLEQTVLQQAEQKLLANTTTDSFQVELLNAFLDKQEQFTCLVTRVPNLNTENDQVRYLQSINRKMKEFDVRPSVFYYKGFRIRQVLILTPETVIFKLIIPQTDGRSFQIDYVIPQNHYQNNLEAIESSIGSLTKL
jgi:hypothetical protein